MTNAIRNLSLLSAFFLLFAGEASGFVVISNAGKPAFWKDGRVLIEFHENESGYFVDGEDASGTIADDFTAFHNAFDAWTEIAGVEISFAVSGTRRTSDPSSTDLQNTIMWVPSGWRSLSFRPPSNALAVTLSSFDSQTGEVVDADIYFNAQTFDWAIVDTEDESDYVDVQNIATHEVGHLLGLDHSSESPFETEADLADATMYYASSAGETSRRLPLEDDILGATNLYGTASYPPAKVDSVEVMSESLGYLELRVTGENFYDVTSFLLTANDFDYYDAVARYKTIVSETEAIVEIDAYYLPDSGLSMVAFNDVRSISKLNIDVEKSIGGSSSNTQSSAASSGGGGCSLQQRGAPPASFFLFLIFLVGLLQLRLAFGFRRQVSFRYVRSKHLEKRSC